MYTESWVLRDLRAAATRLRRALCAQRFDEVGAEQVLIDRLLDQLLVMRPELGCVRRRVDTPG